ncbi:plasmid recombination protein [Acidithiobacillus sp. HP-11]|uniref:plasmid recombination protein n=1 Tax=Acidithiobacillus sp. HP-11 TaxID=2697656 RepID=UPI001879574C|nr:plasmid recombination protein [Acidithiobacillus sp. HP-11]MBE7567552.1 plasmid recombination protein [Acidithiobacillus sp. HP-11]
MSLTVSIRIRRLTASQVIGQNRHDLRQAIPGYVDQERTADNDILLAPANPTTLRQTCSERRAQRNCQRILKSNAAIAMGGIITFGTEAQAVILALPKADQRAMYQSVAQQLAERLNTTLTGLVVHNDEAAPHAHFQMPGYDRDGVPLSKTVTREVTRQLQDIAGEVLAARGLNITRGKAKQERVKDEEDWSKIIHRSVQQLHDDLPAEIATAEQRRAEAEREAAEAEIRREKNETLATKARQDSEAGRGDAEKVQKRLAAYERRQTDAEAKIKALEQEQADLEVAIARKQKTAGHIQGEMPHLVSAKKRLSKNLTVTPEDLADYHQQVAGYIRDEIAAKVESAVQAEKARIVQREQAVRAQESQMNGQEAELQAWHETLNTREKRLTSYDAANDENQKLRHRLDMVGMHVGSILGIQNASMNRGKVLKAVEASSSMESFQKALAEQKLNLGVSRRNGPGD